jgi:hypothetical protein
MKIGWTTNQGKTVDFIVEILLVPNVIPKSKCIDTAPKKFQGYLTGNTCPTCGIFPIGHDQVEVMLLSIGRQSFLEKTATRTAYDVSEK